MQHWLSAAAARARIPFADRLSIDPADPVPAAWDAAIQTLGITGHDLAACVAPILAVDVANLDAAQPRALTLLPERIARRYQVFPLREDDRTITVATSDPNDVQTEQAISFASARRAIFEIAPPGAITDAINAAYSPDRAVERLLSSVDEHIADAVRIVEETTPEAVAEQDVASGPVVKLTSLIIRDAVLLGASDVHIEPGPKGGVVRFRIDGVLRPHMSLPMGALNRIVSRIKVLAKLDIADRTRPQDGRARVSVGGATYDLRVSTVPTRDAEKAVIRVLRPDTAKTLEGAGIPANERTLLRQLLGFREGIVLVTGPTGSGKTTTMYAALREVAGRDVNVTTVEDPIEYELPGITQLQVDARRGITFASALRAILRQDPDVVFVGEIRDLETAEIAVQASMTGHLVLATLHTNDALSAVTRLNDLGVPRASIAASLRGSVAQRLIRRACRECVQPVKGELNNDEQRLAALYGVRPAVRAIGCPSCGETGYRGRLPILEIAMASSSLGEMIAGTATAAALQRTAIAAGMQPLRDAALERVRAGETTLQEVERVVGDVGDDVRPSGPVPVVKPAAAPGEPLAPRILVVDDDPLLRIVASKLLRESGYRVEAVNDGAEALHRLRVGDDVSLVVTDLHMPAMGGAELLKALRASPETASLTVIVLTSSDDQAEEIRLMDGGADDYIRKPIDPDRFAARIRAALRRANL